MSAAEIPDVGDVIEWSGGKQAVVTGVTGNGSVEIEHSVEGSRQIAAGSIECVRDDLVPGDIGVPTLPTPANEVFER